ncbi:Uncharacterised protein [Klebsiella pneumoniae]|nr:Uncharacterised protein [Klebsiella pneumoniae]
MRAGTDLIDLQQLQPAAVQQLNGLFAIQRLLQLNVAAVVRVEVLVHTAKGYRMAIGFNLQDKLNEVAQLQRLPEGFRRLMGDDVAVFGNRQQFVAA